MSSLNFNLLNLPGLEDILKEVSSSCQQLNIDFFIIGAVARNIWLASNDKALQGTRDLDFGVYISNPGKYQMLKELLIRSYDFTPSPNNAFCLISPNGIEIDLLPFGEIGNSSTVLLEGIGLQEVQFDGLEEAYLLGSTTIKIGRSKYHTCTMPAMVALKLIAYDDRPEHRIKDTQDINAILQYYPELETEFIWEKYNELYEKDREHNQVAMLALGNEIRKIVQKNARVYQRLIDILNRAISRKSRLVANMILNPEQETTTQKVLLLTWILEGLQK